MQKIKKNWKGLPNLFYKHDFSLLWANIILCSSFALVIKDMPAVVRETLPYNGILIGVIGIIISIVKYSSIKYRNYYFHCVVDFLGSTWLIAMGMVTTTAVPPMMFTGVILYVAGVMVNLRLFQRIRINRNIKRFQATKRR